MSSEPPFQPPQRIAIVGASLSGLRMAERLRTLGFGGELVLVGQEVHFPPFDRPPMSKGMLTGLESESVRLSVAAELDASVITGQTVLGLSADLHSIALSDGRSVEFDGLGVATGSTPRRLSCEGDGLDGVLYMRNVEDSWGLASRLRPGVRVAVIGAGFIGCEIAASCRKMGADVIIVDPLPRPMARALGPAASAFVTAVHRANGIEFRMGVGVAGIIGDSKVEGIQLTDGQQILADIAVVGIGSVPETLWLTGTGLVLDDGLVCEGDLSARGAAHIVAAGDVARWEHRGYGRLLRVEHWTNAVEQAEHAADTLLAPKAERSPYVGVPYFWSDQYDVKLQYVGIPGADEEIIEGSLTDARAVVGYSDHGKLVGALCINWPNRLVRHRIAMQREMTAGATQQIA